MIGALTPSHFIFSLLLDHVKSEHF